MKQLLTIYLIILIGCKTNSNNNHTEKNNAVNTEIKDEATKIGNGIYYWNGNINSNIPIFIWMVFKDSLIQGEVTYLKTKKQIPIKLLGNIEKNGEIRAYEYQPDGNITGLFIFDSINKNSKGTWVAIKNDKEFKFEILSKDTVINNIDTSFQSQKLSGDYAYSYDKQGAQGNLNVTDIENRKIAFTVTSVTSDPARNIAHIDTDTVSISNNEFIYKVPDSENCIIKVKFFKDFVFIDYVQDYGDCGTVFGLNAGVDGIFYRIKE